MSNLYLCLRGIVSNVPQYLAQVLPIDVPVPVRVEPSEGAGELLYLSLGEGLVVTVYILQTLTKVLLFQL